MFYWLVTLVTIISVFFTKKNAKFYLLIGFYIFITGAVLKTINLNGISEILMRISFICWIVGLAMAIREFRQ